MKILIRVVAHLTYIIGLLILFCLPINQYSWLQDIAPSIAPPVDEASGSRTIFAFLLLFLIVATQSAVVVTSTKSREKRISVALILVATSFWLVRLMG